MNQPHRVPRDRQKDMAASIPAQILERVGTFGELLRYLRRRAGLTQTELSIAVGYSDAQISRLEQNLRLPNIATLTPSKASLTQSDESAADGNDLTGDVS